MVSRVDLGGIEPPSCTVNLRAIDNLQARRLRGVDLHHKRIDGPPYYTRVVCQLVPFIATLPSAGRVASVIPHRVGISIAKSGLTRTWVTCYDRGISGLFR